MRKLFLIAIAGIGLWLAGLQASAPYPVQVMVTFRYLGQDVTKTALTTLRITPNSFWVGGHSWSFGKGKILVALSDGSAAIVFVEGPSFPSDADDLPPGYPYSYSPRWLWINNIKSPDQVVFGDSYRTYFPGSSQKPDFVALEATANIERVDGRFLRDAVRSDTAHDDADKLLFSNQAGGSLTYDGLLFAGLWLTPLGAIAPESDVLRHSDGWINLADHCRIKPMAEAMSLKGLAAYTDAIGLLRHGDLWTTRGGPRTNESSVMFATDMRVTATSGKDWSVFQYRAPAMRMLGSVEWNGAICEGIRWDEDTINAVLEFPNGGLALVSPSDEIVVMKP